MQGRGTGCVQPRCAHLWLSRALPTGLLSQGSDKDWVPSSTGVGFQSGRPRSPYGSQTPNTQQEAHLDLNPGCTPKRPREF